MCEKEGTEGLSTPSLEEDVSPFLVTPPLFIQSTSQMGRTRCKYEAELYTQVTSTKVTQLNGEGPKFRPRPMGLAPALTGLWGKYFE